MLELSLLLPRQYVSVLLIISYVSQVSMYYCGAYHYSGGKESNISGGRTILMNFILDQGVDACYAEPHSRDRYCFTGNTIELVCANLNKGLPMTSIDYDVRDSSHFSWTISVGLRIS